MFLRTSKSRDGHYRSHSAENKTEDLWRKETIWGWVYWGKSARGKLSGRSREHPVLTEAKGLKTLEEMKDRKGRRERQGRKGDHETVLILTKPKNNIKRRCSSVNGSILSKAYSQNMLIGTFLVVRWLRLHLPMQEVQVWPLVRELRSHMLCGQKIKT